MRQSTKMTKSEPRTDFQKVRDKGQSFVGKTVTFRVFKWKAEYGTMIDTGKQKTGVVSYWDDATQILRVAVRGNPLPFDVKLEHLIEEKNE